MVNKDYEFFYMLPNTKDMIQEILVNHNNRLSHGGTENIIRKVANGMEVMKINSRHPVPEIVFITSYPPRECGIATYSQDLIKALNNKFSHSFKINICPVESDIGKHTYREDIKYVLNIDYPEVFLTLAESINDNNNISMVMIQHEFGLFKKRKMISCNFYMQLINQL